MKTAVLLAGLVFTLASCGPPNAVSDPVQRSETRQVPSNYTPGVHVSGYANVGVVKRF